jgi:hypothetical protein
MDNFLIMCAKNIKGESSKAIYKWKVFTGDIFWGRNFGDNNNYPKNIMKIQKLM